MIQSLNLVFCGTPRFAVPTLERLVEAGFEVSLVVTQPDRPKGRGLELVASPVKQRAVQLGLPITQPERIKNHDDFRGQLTDLKPDAIIVVGYGRIIPQWMLDLPALGNINIHGSLLPKYRGAAPIQWAIAGGESETGVTIFQLDDAVDHGKILAQVKTPIGPDETAGELFGRLSAMGRDLLLTTVADLESGRARPLEQNHSEATPAPKLKKEDGRIDWNQPAASLHNRVR